MIKENDNLKDYLDYYQGLKNPGYAVLVTGEWGSGKTYRVKEILPEQKRYYISLYGASTPEQIHAELFSAAFPKLSKAERNIKSIANLAASVGGKMALANSLPLLFSTITKRNLDTDKTIIFDDIERCTLDKKITLGIINNYVEHGGFKAIVILHDQKVEKDFSEVKEKTIGQTIRIQPDFNSAIVNFIDSLESQEARRFMNDYLREIIDIYLMSSIQSLRILRHTILDLNRLHELLRPHHIANKAAMQELVCVCTMISMEAKSGSITKEELLNQDDIQRDYNIERHGNNNNEIAEPNIVKVSKKYLLNLRSKTLDLDCLSAMFFDGHFDESKIRRSIDNSIYFAKEEDTPPWKIIINFDDLDDATVEHARRRMEEKLNNKEITIPGEILHTFTLKMMMAAEGIENDSFENIKDKAFSYVSELAEAGTLAAWKNSDDNFRMTSYDHIGFWVKDEYQEHFETIYNHIISEQKRVLELNAGNIHDTILELMHNDSEKLIGLLAHTNSSTGKYADYPILKSLPPAEFVERWLTAPIKNWRKIQLALSCRYYANMLKDKLVDEEPWAAQVGKLMLEQADVSKGFRGLRIARTIPDTLKSLAAEHS